MAIPAITKFLAKADQHLDEVIDILSRGFQEMEHHPERALLSDAGQLGEGFDGLIEDFGRDLQRRRYFDKITKGGVFKKT